ncbi:hypothetical protein [Celeribacter litoreus]|uniref:hypothetical protein n=1 Tax=Celeribacter litoreus TaxID=2876714 RepID=UPI001CD0029E|nr:hypothetical protein [Celeribacter litoreus]MCA0042041.1 hypothetical protein [Celeribacter litoreus]
MENVTVFLPKSTVEMLHLLAREEGQTIGAVIQEMALDRYMHRVMTAGEHRDAEAAVSVDYRKA